MKKIFTFAMSAFMASTVWANVITLDMNANINPDALEFGENGVWTECYNDVDYTWLEFGNNKGEFMFSHLIAGEGSSWGGYYWDGFTPAIGGDQTDYGMPGTSGGWTTNYGGCMAGGGCVINEDGTVTADPDQPYLVAYYASFWGFPTNEVMFVDRNGNTDFTPVGVYVCNHPWPYYGCVHGDGMARAFEEGDYFELTAVGVGVDGVERTASINLIEFTDGELKEHGYLLLHGQVPGRGWYPHRCRGCERRQGCGRCAVRQPGRYDQRQALRRHECGSYHLQRRYYQHRKGDQVKEFSE